MFNKLAANTHLSLQKDLETVGWPEEGGVMEELFLGATSTQQESPAQNLGKASCGSI